MKIHDEIDNYLAADLHSDLSDEEQNALHVHLVECASCRQAHQESKIMNKVLEEKFADEKPDVAFEQRMLAGFRNRIPQKTGGVARFVVDLMRLRATQVAAVAALLVALVQVGRMITGESAVTSNRKDDITRLPVRGPAPTDLVKRLPATESKTVEPMEAAGDASRSESGKVE